MPVIEILSSGFGIVNRRLWLIVVPLLLDLLLWLGPQVTAAPLAARGVELYDQLVAVAPLAYQPPPEVLEEQYHQIQSSFEALGQVNLLRLLVTPLVFDLLASPLPSLAVASTSAMASPTSLYWGAIGDGGGLLALWLGMAAAGYLLASLYLSAMARSVKERPGPWFGEVVWGWGRLVLFALLVVAGALFVGLPLVLLLSVAGLVVPEVVSFIGMALIGGLLALAVGLYFVNPALFVGEAGVLGAIRQSLGLVRRNLAASLGFITLVTIIHWGISQAWTPLLEHPLGVFVAIVGNAYIATGLGVAVMIFYREKARELVKGTT